MQPGGFICSLLSILTSCFATYSSAQVRESYVNFQKQLNPPGKAMDPFCMTSDQSNGWLLAGAFYLPTVNDLIFKTTCLIHLNEQGCADWSRTMMSGQEEVIQSIISTRDSGYLISAFPYQSQQDNYPGYLHVFKIDKFGNKQWSYSFSNGTAVNNYYSDMTEAGTGGYLLEIGSFPISGYPTFISIIKIDPAGRFIWGRELGMENNSFHNIGGIVEKNNFIYASGSMYKGVPPFDFIRSFLVQLDESTGQVNWTKQNDPLLAPLTLTDIHFYKRGLLINSYTANRMNNLLFSDDAGNITGSKLINNPYGSLNGKENILITPDNGLYFHQSSGSSGGIHKDIMMRLDSNQQIAWQYDFSGPDLNFSGWIQLSSAPRNGVASIGSGLMINNYKAVNFIKLDSLGQGCHNGQTDLFLQSNDFTLVPMVWNLNSSSTMTVTDQPLEFDELDMLSRLSCPGLITGCDLLELDGPIKICKVRDTARYTLVTDPFCPEPVIWTYDTNLIRVLSSGDTFRTIQYSKPGNYIIKVEKNGCNQNLDSIVVSVGSNISEINLPRDTVLCYGNTMKLDAGSGYADYLWQNGTVNQSIEVSDTGVYWVKLNSTDGCSYNDTSVIHSIEPSPEFFLPADTVLCAGESWILNPLKSFDAFVWSTGSTGGSIKVKDPGLYTLQVTDSFGCKGIDTILIGIKNCPAFIHFPNAFTPNSDGHNDKFKPIISGSLVLYQFRIYNRWGQCVFETTDPKKGWDGKWENVEQGNGAYIWICSYQFVGKSENTGKGSLLLLQ